MSKFENVEDILPLGKKVIKIEPQDRYELFTDGQEHFTKDGRPMKGHFVKDEQQIRIIKNGRNAGKKFWVFKSPDVIGSNGYPVQINAWDEKQKALFDTGLVEVNVIEGKDWVTDESGNLVIVDGKGIKKKKAFFNPISDEEYDKRFFEKMEEEKAAELFDGKVVEEDIKIEDIPF